MIDLKQIESLACKGLMTFEVMLMVKQMAERLNNREELIEVQKELIENLSAEIEIHKKHAKDIDNLIYG